MLLIQKLVAIKQSVSIYEKLCFTVTLAANHYTKPFIFSMGASFPACCISTRFVVASNEF